MTNSRITKEFNKEVHTQIFVIIEEHKQVLNSESKEKSQKKLVQELIVNAIRESYFQTQKNFKEQQEQFHEYGVMDYYKMQNKLVTLFECYKNFAISEWVERYFCSLKKY